MTQESGQRQERERERERERSVLSLYPTTNDSSGAGGGGVFRKRMRLTRLQKGQRTCLPFATDLLYPQRHQPENRMRYPRR